MHTTDKIDEDVLLDTDSLCLPFYSIWREVLFNDGERKEVKYEKKTFDDLCLVPSDLREKVEFGVTKISPTQS